MAVAQREGIILTAVAADTKPASGYSTGTLVLETDTGKTFINTGDETTSAWTETPGSTLNLGGVNVIDADRELAITLNPATDDTLDLGSNALRYANVNATTLNVWGASGPANPILKFDNAGIWFGAGGASAVDVNLVRGDQNRLDLAASDHLQIPSGDLRFDSATNGIILKDTQGTPHYWRVTITNAGALETTDLGTSLPST